MLTADTDLVTRIYAPRWSDKLLNFTVFLLVEFYVTSLSKDHIGPAISLIVLLLNSHHKYNLSMKLNHVCTET